MMSCSLPCCARVWRQLHDRPGKHSSDHIWQGGSLQGTALSYGILFWPPPRLTEVHFHSAFCLANQNSPRFHPWPRFNSLFQESPWQVEVIHWMHLFVQVQLPFSFLSLILNLFFKGILFYTITCCWIIFIIYLFLQWLLCCYAIVVLSELWQWQCCTVVCKNIWDTHFW